jgi:hypothetical protein
MGQDDDAIDLGCLDSTVTGSHCALSASAKSLAGFDRFVSTCRATPDRAVRGTQFPSHTRVKGAGFKPY